MNTMSVAYFSMEFGLESNFKIYAGGLGVLAGDFIKAAKDNNFPVIGIGIKWKQGYVEQHIDGEGRIVDSFYNNEYNFLKDTGIKISVKIRGREVFCKVWLVDCFGNASLYLLDTDLPENQDRWITGQLYGWFEEERIAQEMVLGIGGIKALRALNINVDRYHFNEGHAVFAGLELIREKKLQGVNPYDALNIVRNQIVFTTHTPIIEGNESHGLDVLEYMGTFNELERTFIKYIGGEPFNMTAAALKLCRRANAVSVLHGKIANDMWKDIDKRSEIISITNGVHVGTWGDKNIIAAWKNHEDIWSCHMKNKKALIDYVYDKKAVRLDENKLLLGFARRAAPYKRGNLIFKDEGKIGPLLKDRTIQIVFASKAHPLDFQGKEIIKNILEFQRKYPEAVVFLDDYDMDKAALLTRGADVWLNNPRITKEACGTSGMKAAINGVLNLSTLDGWWPEACWDEVTGWQIGDGIKLNSIEEQDDHDASCLYKVLIDKVIKTYYGDKETWKHMMYASINGIIDRYSADRMIKEYYERLYM